MEEAVGQRTESRKDPLAVEGRRTGRKGRALSRGARAAVGSREIQGSLSIIRGHRSAALADASVPASVAGVVHAERQFGRACVS